MEVEDVEIVVEGFGRHGCLCSIYRQHSPRLEIRTIVPYPTVEAGDRFYAEYLDNGALLNWSRTKPEHVKWTAIIRERNP